LPEDLVQVNEILGVKLDEVLVIGQVNNLTQKVAIIKRATGQIVDQFLAYSISPSPNGNFVAFVKFYPAHFVARPSDYVMVYDLRYNASLNRPRGVALDEETDVGKAIYPPGIETTTPNTDVPESMIHRVIAAKFFWSPDSSQFLFADETVLPAVEDPPRLPKAAIDLVLVDVAKFQTVPSVLVFPAITCISQGGSCGMQLTTVDFGQTGVSAEFQGSGFQVGKIQALQAAFSQFKPPEKNP
jgi:hypothetical protein